MKNYNKIIILLLVSLLVVLGAFWQTGSSVSIAPGVVFKTITGETIALSELKGKPVLVTFWASDCHSCIQEIPDFIQLHQQFKSQELTIIAVAMSYDPPNQVLNVAQEKHIPYKVALDPQGELGTAFGNVQFTPSLFLFDKLGQLVFQKTGLVALSELQKHILALG
ncbi:TlpA disulfide reductase family protein [Methylomonas sp. AM2-LC]|uniref:TlpA disulfide reductase family protein n=1 Tax=Methylomonas sp. AM2-LC TaxID=3153301 RepID=UPI0032676FDC